MSTASAIKMSPEEKHHHSIKISDGTVIDFTGASREALGTAYVWITNAQQQIATLQQRVAELEEERRKDIEDAFEEGVSIGIGCRIGTGVDVEYIDTKKALYLSQFDQTKTEGV